MRAVRDNQLPEPFRFWIDPNQSLPDGIQLLPRSVYMWHDFWTLITATFPFATMSILIAALMLPPWKWNFAEGGRVTYLFLATFCLSHWAVPILYLRRWLITLGAARDQRQGRPRQGILLGPAGLLVRMEPNWCYPISWDRYVKTKRSYRGGTSVLQLETLDGPVEFLDGRLGTNLEGIQLGIRQVRPPELKPTQVERGKRERRTDFRPRQRLLRAAAFFMGSMLMLGASTMGVILVGENSPATDWLAFGILISLVLLVPATIYGIHTALSIQANYRCPTCGERLPRADEARPAFHFYCANCNVEWNTKLVAPRRSKFK